MFDKLDIDHFVKNILLFYKWIKSIYKNSLLCKSKFNFKLNFIIVKFINFNFFLYQLILGSFLKNKIPHSNELIISLSITFILYALSHIQIDVRIIISALSPFLIYFQPHLLTLKSISLIISILILILPLKLFFYKNFLTHQFI